MKTNINNKTSIEQFVIEKVKQFRIESNVSQADLAYKLGVSAGFIGKVESRKFSSKYNLNHLNKLAEIFNRSPKDFLPDNKL
ncbi:MAG: helix-turn-helix domain-containing protein [Pyrinomonadaceae bacterium]